MSQVQITAEEVDKIILDKIKKRFDFIKLDDKYFIDLLRHSLSLSTTEKKRVVDSFPILSQFQFDELIKVFVDEREKFKDLSKQHPEDIKKLLAKQKKERLELGDIYVMEGQKQGKTQEDKAKIDDIKGKLGL